VRVGVAMMAVTSAAAGAAAATVAVAVAAVAAIWVAALARVGRVSGCANGAREIRVEKGECEGRAETQTLAREPASQ
jgi:hypothetical protein